MNVTTTNDPRGGGHPRLLFALGDNAQQDSEQREFELSPGVTVIGSGADADVRLSGLDERHAEVLRDAADEYLYVDLGTLTGSIVDGRPVDERVLHTGDRIELGKWTLSFYREEFADPDHDAGARPDYHDPTAGFGGAAPARSALTLRLVLASFGLILCGIAAVAALTVAEQPVLALFLAVLAAAAAVDIAVISGRKRRGEPG